MADALGIAASELTRQLEPTPGNGEGAAVKAARRALIAVSRNDPAAEWLVHDNATLVLTT